MNKCDYCGEMDVSDEHLENHRVVYTSKQIQEKVEDLFKARMSNISYTLKLIVELSDDGLYMCSICHFCSYVADEVNHHRCRR